MDVDATLAAEGDALWLIAIRAERRIHEARVAASKTKVTVARAAALRRPNDRSTAAARRRKVVWLFPRPVRARRV